MKYAVDDINGGFFGKVDNENIADTDAPKGAVINARILWTFSAAYNFCKDEKYLSTATRAFEYIRDHFIDKRYKGVYWTVDSKGKCLIQKNRYMQLHFAYMA